MLWRPAYQTLVARDLILPPIPFGSDIQILIGAFGFHAMREMSLWRRLVEADASHTHWAQAFFFSHPGSREAEVLDSMVPASQRDRTFIGTDIEEAWRNLVQPDRPEQSFAAVISGNQAKIMMKGIPTEDAWDAFLKELD